MVGCCRGGGALLLTGERTSPPVVAADNALRVVEPNPVGVVLVAVRDSFTQKERGAGR
jgi:hypothetical protein